MLKRLQKRVLRARLGPAIVVVSGLPRSGTSLMMGMLKVGGLPLLQDGARKADADNPEGYYELERTKSLAGEQDKSWLRQARDRAVKIISELLPELPPDFFYQVIFMTRHLDEVIASQNKMLIRRGSPPEPGSQTQVRELLQEHLRKIRGWLERQANFEVLEVSYHRILEQPLEKARQINSFLRGRLQEEPMAAVVNPELHRNRVGPL